MPKILVADDNSNIQKMVALAFQDRGIEVVAVGNGEAAVRRLPDFEPDLILADIFMPVRSGYEVCEFVKKSERFSQTPVILLVGAFDPLDEKEARRVGADGVLKKPFIPPDPLIAMVMSALEKNPRVVAEMAKAKQAKEAPELPPMPQLEIPVRTAPKPLPTFPEPTPDEAALIYGFGSGRRALDDAGNGVTAEPQEVVAEAEDSDAEFDAAATSRDWRRTAMDFEVPEADSHRPAFSSDEDLEQTSPASKSDLPADAVAVTQAETTASPVIPEQAEALVPTEVESAAEPEVASHEVPDVPLVPVEQEEFDQEKSLPEQNVPAASHWMDAVASTQTEYPQPQRNWLDALSTQSEETAIVSSVEGDPVPADQVSHITVESEPQLPASAIESAEAATEVVTAPDGHEVSASVEENPRSWEADPQSNAQPLSDDSFFAEEPAATATKDPWFAPEQTAEQAPLATQSEAVPSIASRNESSPESGSLEPEPTDTNSLALRDPNLVEPEAVRVTPEPLLVHDEPQETSQYGSIRQAEPEHSFFAPPVESPVTEEVTAVQAPSHPDTWAQSFESSPDGTNERIPTMPPPNLEALAEIPFLTPPANLHMERREQSASNPEMVDEIVRRVLESLEPRLHDLLAQEVLKPLVENILQSEVSKGVTTR